jgi:hypothetical protein
MNTDQNTGRGLGTAALVLGILGILTSFIPCFGFWSGLFGILAIIFGAISISNAKKSDSPKGMGVAGLIMGIISLSFSLVWYFILASMLGLAATGMSAY